MTNYHLTGGEAGPTASDAPKSADAGHQAACTGDRGPGYGIMARKGKVTNKAVAEFFNMEWMPSSVVKV